MSKKPKMGEIVEDVEKKPSVNLKSNNSAQQKEKTQKEVTQPSNPKPADENVVNKAAENLNSPQQKDISNAKEVKINKDISSTVDYQNDNEKHSEAKIHQTDVVISSENSLVDNAGDAVKSGNMSSTNTSGEITEAKLGVTNEKDEKNPIISCPEEPMEIDVSSSENVSVDVETSAAINEIQNTTNTSVVDGSEDKENPVADLSAVNNLKSKNDVLSTGNQSTVETQHDKNKHSETSILRTDVKETGKDKAQREEQAKESTARSSATTIEVTEVLGKIAENNVSKESVITDSAAMSSENVSVDEVSECDVTTDKDTSDKSATSIEKSFATIEDRENKNETNVSKESEITELDNKAESSIGNIAVQSYEPSLTKSAKKVMFDDQTPKRVSIIYPKTPISLGKSKSGNTKANTKSIDAPVTNESNVSLNSGTNNLSNVCDDSKLHSKSHESMSQNQTTDVSCDMSDADVSLASDVIDDGSLSEPSHSYDSECSQKLQSSQDLSNDRMNSLKINDTTSAILVSDTSTEVQSSVAKTNSANDLSVSHDNSTEQSAAKDDVSSMETSAETDEIAEPVDADETTDLCITTIANHVKRRLNDVNDSINVPCLTPKEVQTPYTTKRRRIDGNSTSTPLSKQNNYPNKEETECPVSNGLPAEATEPDSGTGKLCFVD